MIEQAVHTNTKAVLRAWQRLATSEGGNLHDPKVSDFPNLLGNLFVLKQVETNVWVFANAGQDLSTHLGRDLVEQDFLSLWRGRDMEFISAHLKAVSCGASPGLLHSRAETLSGDTMDIELALAPLSLTNDEPDKMLGLYQSLCNAGSFHGRPAWRHSVSAIFPPSQDIAQPNLRLVANNQ